MRTRAQGGTPLVGGLAGTRVKPFRDTVIRSKSVPCPECHAAAGEPCQVATRGSYHVHRRQMAIRARNAEMGLKR